MLGRHNMPDIDIDHRDYIVMIYSHLIFSVPYPIIEESNRFARKIIQHLFHLFVPRKGGGKDKLLLIQNCKGIVKMIILLICE